MNKGLGQFIGNAIPLMQQQEEDNVYGQAPGMAKSAPGWKGALGSGLQGGIGGAAAGGVPGAVGGTILGILPAIFGGK